MALVAVHGAIPDPVVPLAEFHDHFTLRTWRIKSTNGSGIPIVTHALLMPAFLMAASLLSVSRACGGPIEPAAQLEIEKRVVARRRAISTAQLELMRTFAVRDPATGTLKSLNSGSSSFSRTRIVVDQEFRRFDETTNSTRMTSPDGSVLVPLNPEGVIEQRFVFTPTEFIVRDATQYQGVGPNTVRTGPRNEARPVEPKDFRVEMLGLIPMPSALLFRSDVDAFYEVPERADCRIDDETLDGLSTRKSSYVRQDGKRVTFWIVPEMNDGVVRTEFSMTLRDGRVRTQRVHSKLKEYDGQIWFPMECEYSCWSGDELIANERWVVKDARFNAPIDPAVFTQAGLELPRGTLVVSSPDTAVKTRDGDVLADTTFLPGPKPAVPAPRTTTFHWFAAINLVAGVFFIGYCFWRRRRE